MEAPILGNVGLLLSHRAFPSTVPHRVIQCIHYLAVHPVCTQVSCFTIGGLFLLRSTVVEGVGKGALTVLLKCIRGFDQLKPCVILITCGEFQGVCVKAKVVDRGERVKDSYGIHLNERSSEEFAFGKRNLSRK